ncbi:MAG TPA: CHAT domain-containing protein [Myxococcus sp.]|nr:CHAT domain-containing protein [Myxococcus sp.]
MNPQCAKLEAFVDGELEPVEAENFRHHLAQCGPCEERLTELLAMEMVDDDARRASEALPAASTPAAPVRALPVWRRKTWLMAVPLALAAGLATLMLVPGREPDTAALFLAQAPTRSLEARVTHPGADRHRPYAVMRSGGSGPQALPLRELARLEDAGDQRGIAIAYLLRGETSQASAILDKLPASADADTDRAVLALQRGAPEEALVLLERALKAEPRHPQALWNQGLALQQLQLPLRAAEAFEQVAALKEPGWSEEAAQRAARLRGVEQEERKDWEGMRNDCARMMDGEVLFTEQQVEARPGMARVCFYNAVRTATSPERLEALRPLAVRLDRREEGTHLEDYVRRASRQDFSVRAPRVRDFIRVTRGELPPTEVEPFLARLRDARLEDMLLGALTYMDPRQHLEEYVALAKATRDPWFALLAEERQARAEALKEQWLAAQERLQAAVRGCGAEKKRQSYRCMSLERELGLLSMRLYRPLEAREQLKSALRMAMEGREWGTRRRLLQELGQVARARNELALARAYMEETLLQTPESCADSEVALSNLALAHHRALDFAGARTYLDRATGCRKQASMTRLALLADLARTPHSAPGDEAQLVQSLEELRRTALEPGEDVLLRHIEGRFFLELDRRKGQELLRQSLVEAAKQPATNVYARKGRAYSYTSLILDAGKHGELEQGLALFAEERSLPVPERCALGVTVDDERTFVVARDAGGRLTGHYDAERKTPLEGVDGLVPTAMVDALRACASVDVLARPPVQGRAGLLPADLAWSYRTGAPPQPQEQARAPKRLVVADVLAPRSLKLPALRAWSPPTPAEGVLTVLRGASATPARVLESLGDATEVQIHAHGIIDPAVADASVLVLSPAGDTGRFALTTEDLQGQRLQGHPVVLLAACHAAHTTAYFHENLGLPLAFVQAGARAVLAATQEIPDAEAADFFEPVLSRIRAGEPAARVLRDERQAWLRRHGSTWVQQVLLFE